MSCALLVLLGLLLVQSGKVHGDDELVSQDEQEDVCDSEKCMEEREKLRMQKKAEEVSRKSMEIRVAVSAAF